MPVILFTGGLPGLNPGDVAGCQLWYDPAFGLFTDEAATTPAADTNAVRAWIDRIAAYKVTTQGVASAAPVLDSDGGNGYPCLNFDATDDRLNTVDNVADSFFSTSNTEFAVVKYADVTPAAEQDFFLFTDGVQNPAFMRNVAGSKRFGAVNYDGTVDTVQTGSDATMTNWNIVTRINDGTNVKVGVNDTRDASLAATLSGATSFGANGNIFIRSVPAACNAMFIAEIAHFNVAVSEANRKLIEQRLAYKYGITLPY